MVNLVIKTMVKELYQSYQSDIKFEVIDRVSFVQGGGPPTLGDKLDRRKELSLARAGREGMGSKIHY